MFIIFVEFNSEFSNTCYGPFNDKKEAIIAIKKIALKLKNQYKCDFIAQTDDIYITNYINENLNNPKSIKIMELHRSI